MSSEVFHSPPKTILVEMSKISVRSQMHAKYSALSLSINGRRILSNVTLLAEGGKMTALTGKSGSGKTTLLNCLGLIHPIDSGKIFVDNNDVTGWRESQRTLFWKDHASFIYQDYGIIDDETVSFNVSLKKFGNNQGQIKEALEIVGLQGREIKLSSFRVGKSSDWELQEQF